MLKKHQNAHKNVLKYILKNKLKCLLKKAAASASKTVPKCVQKKAQKAKLKNFWAWSIMHFFNEHFGKLVVYLSNDKMCGKMHVCLLHLGCH